MADNTTLNSGSGGDVISTDDLGSVKVQRVKVQFGVDGSATDVSTSNPLPVSDAGGSITVDGTVELGPTALAALETITVASITAAIPAGTNNIGDVDVLSVVPGTSATSLGKAEDAAHASGDVGVMALAVRQDTLATLSSATGDYEPIHLDASGRVYANAQVTAQATGGFTPGKLNSAASTNATSVKGSAGTLAMCVVTNTNAAVRYLKFYNKATAPTVGTDTPVLVIAVPGSTTGGGVAMPIPPQGIAFSTGIAFAMTTGAADSDTTGVAANELIVSYAYA